MVNGDILDGITLLNGSYPQRYGNRLGAELDFHMRDGSRDRAQTRVGVSGTDASIVVEGPLGRREGRLVAGLGAQELPRAAAEADRPTETTTSASASATCSRSSSTTSRPRIALELSLVAGQSRLDQTHRRRRREHSGRRAQPRARSSTRRWRFTASPSFVVTERARAGDADSSGTRTSPASSSAAATGATSPGATDFVATRSAVAHVRGRRHRSSGSIASSIERELARAPAPPFVVHVARRRTRTLSSAYAQARWTPGHRAPPSTAGGRARRSLVAHATTRRRRRGCRRSCGCAAR